MGLEMPLMTAVVARLANPDIHLAAYGGIVFPLALIIESPIIMLLAASTALSKDWRSYQLLYRFMMITSFLLTVLHVLVAFTPLYYVVVRDIMGVPAEILEPARWGLMIMTPWTWAIAYRRFQQGVLIRFDHSKAVTVGTMIRMATMATILFAGLALQSFAGIIVASTAIALGVLFEAIYAGLRVRPVLQNQLHHEPEVTPPLTYRKFGKFYVPLAMTSLLTLIALPIGSAAMSRMPDAIHSLDVWPVVNGLIFLLGSTGLAYQEVVVTLLDRPRALANLRKFAAGLSALTSGLLFLIALTPLSKLVLQNVMGLPDDLYNLSRSALLIGGLRPALMVTLHWYQGIVVHSHKTRAITEAIGIGLFFTALGLYLGATQTSITGIYVGIGAFTIGTIVQTLWLFIRSRGLINELHKCDHNREAYERSTAELGEQIAE